MQKWRKTHVCGNRGKPPCEKRIFVIFASCVSSIIPKGKEIKKYAHHYNRCKIRRGIQIQGQNRVTMQRKAGKCRKLSENYKIACRKKRCRKIPSAPITIWNNIKKRQLLAPGRCPQTHERFSYNGFSNFSFLNFPPFLVAIGAN